MINCYSIQKLEEYIDNKSALSETKLDPKQLAEPVKTLWNEYAMISIDVAAVGVVYIAGFNGILGGKLKKESPTLIGWVKSVSRHRSASIIAGMSASLLTATLEDFTDALAELWAKNSADFEREVGSLGLGSMADLKREIRPTAKTGQWFEKLDKYLGYKADTELAVIIEDMLKHRTTAGHEDISRFPPVSGEQLKMWALGTRCLISELIQCVMGGIDKCGPPPGELLR